MCTIELLSALEHRGRGTRGPCEHSAQSLLCARHTVGQVVLLCQESGSQGIWASYRPRVTGPADGRASGPHYKWR